MVIEINKSQFSFFKLINQNKGVDMDPPAILQRIAKRLADIGLVKNFSYPALNLAINLPIFLIPFNKGALKFWRKSNFSNLSGYFSIFQDA